MCKEGLKKNAIDEFAEYRMVVNRHYLGAIIQSDFVMDALRKELKKISPGIKVENDEIVGILKNEVLKRELLDSQESKDAQDKYLKILRKAQKDREKTKAAPARGSENSAPAVAAVQL